MAWGACFSVLRLGAFTVVLAASEPATRGRLVGVYQSVSRLGPVLSLLIGGLLVEAIGYHATFGLLALATLPAALLALGLPAAAYHPRATTGPGTAHQAPITDQPIDAASRAPERWGWRERWFGSRRLVAVKLGMLTNGFAAQGVVLATLTLALADVAGTAEGAAALGGLLVAFRWGADLSLAPAFGHLSDRIGRGRMIPALLIVEAIAVAALIPAGDRAGVVVATLAVVLASTALTAASDAAAGDLAPAARRADVMSGYSDWIDIGSAIGPPLAFALAEGLGLRASYGVTAVLLAGVGCWFVLAWRRAASPPAPRHGSPAAGFDG
jgi:MFS family permease